MGGTAVTEATHQATSGLKYVGLTPAGSINRTVAVGRHPWVYKGDPPATSKIENLLDY